MTFQRRGRRRRYGELLNVLGARKRLTSRYDPERAVVERERQAKSKALLEGGKVKGVDEFGPVGQQKKLGQ